MTHVIDNRGVRMTVDGITGEVRQSLEYLPSGYVFRSDNYAEQPYMFCGEELVKMHGFDQYDSNARFQHSKQPRFSSIDPLAEKYYNLSPYNYAGNDPVNAADPSGEMLFIYSEDGEIPFARETEEKYGNKIHFYTYVAGLGLYVEYSSSSQKSDYNNIEIDGGTIGEASVIAKKRK